MWTLELYVDGEWQAWDRFERFDQLRSAAWRLRTLFTMRAVYQAQ